MPSCVELVRCPSLAPAPYADAATVPPDSTVIMLAGCCPLDRVGATVGNGDYAAQTLAVLANLETVLAEVGAALTDVVSTRVLVATTQRSDLTTVWQHVADHFGAHDVPSTLLGVTVLGYPDQLVEVEAMVALRSDRAADDRGAVPVTGLG